MGVIDIDCYKSSAGGVSWECNVVSRDSRFRRHNDFYLSRWSMKSLAEKFSRVLNHYTVKTKIFKKLFKD